MQQQGILARNRASISIATKLLIGVSLLVVLTVTFLSFSAIVLVSEDKRAYLFQSEANESYLMGRDFAGTLQRSIDALRLALGSSDLSHELTPTQRGVIQANLDNQSTLVAARVGRLSANTQAFNWEPGWLHNVLASKVGVQIHDFEGASANFAGAVPTLMAKGAAIVNVSQLGRLPLVSVLYSDRTPMSSGEFGVAVGFFALSDLSHDFRGNRVTIATLAGEVLFDTDSTLLSTHAKIKGDPLFEFAASARVDSGTRDYSTAEGRFIGSYYRPGYDVVVLSRASWRAAMAATYTLTEKFILLGLMALSSTMVFGFIFAKRLSAPINLLYQATKSVTEGKFDVQLNSTSRDEIGALTRSFSAMSKKIDQLIIEGMRKVQLENEIAIASTVQQTLIPPPQVDTLHVKIRSFYRAAQVCGGDWWGFFTKDDRVYCMIADATGHGLPSALITASAHSCVSVLAKLVHELPGWSPSPGEMMAICNRAIFGASGGKINMTFFIAELNFTTKEIRFANAGHYPPWLFQLGPDGEYTHKSLVAHGERLGERRDVEPFEERVVPFNSGDLLFLYTDAMLETTDSNNVMFGKKQAVQTVLKSIKEGPAEMIADLEQAIMLHSGNKPLDDDLTLVAVQTL